MSAAGLLQHISCVYHSRLHSDGQGFRKLFYNQPLLFMGQCHLDNIETGSIPGITEEYEKIPEKETSGHAENAGR